MKVANPVAPIKLGLKMCVLPRGSLIQAWLTQFQVGCLNATKKTAQNGQKWPFLAIFGLKTYVKLGVEP